MIHFPPSSAKSPLLGVVNEILNRQPGLKSVQDSNVSMDFRLHEGDSLLDLHQRQLRLHLGVRNCVHLTAQLANSESQALFLKSLQLKLDQPISLENSVSSIVNPTRWGSRTLTSFLDKVVKLQVNEINVDENGKIRVDGFVNILGGYVQMQLADQPFIQKKFDSLSVNLEHFQPGNHRALNLNDLATFAAFSTSLIQGVQYHLDAHFKPESTFESIDVGGALTLRNKGDKTELRLNLQGDLTKLNQLQARQAEIGCDSAQLRAFGIVSLQTGKVPFCDGEGTLNVEVENPKVKTHGVSAHINGKVQAGFLASTLSYMKGALFPVSRGAFQYAVLQQSTQKNFRIEPLLGSALFDTTQDAKSTLTSIHSGVERVIAPLGAGGVGLREGNTKSTRRSGNQVDFLVDGKMAFPKRLELIKSATKEINLQTFIFKDDESSMTLAQALADAAHNGVSVRVLVDAQGNVDRLKALLTENKALKLMKDHGVDVRLHNDRLVLGLRRLFQVAQKNPEIFSFADINGFQNKPAVLKTFALLTQAAYDTNETRISREDQKELVAAINYMFNKPEDSKELIPEILQLQQGNSLDLLALIPLIASLGNQAFSCHEKSLLVDGEQAIIGGMNIADSYMKGGSTYQTRDGETRPGWRDMDIYLKGPSVYDISEGFAQNWKRVTGESLTPLKSVEELSVPSILVDDPCDVEIIHHLAKSNDLNRNAEFIIKHLNDLKPGQPAYFETAYFMPNGLLEDLKEAFIHAAMRGVDVRIITNSETSTDAKALPQAAFFGHRELVQAGVRVFLRSDNRMIHTKIACFGDDIATIGSWNLDSRSLVNGEYLVPIYSKTKAKEMRAILENDMSPDVTHELKFEDIEVFPIQQELAHGLVAMTKEIL